MQIDLFSAPEKCGNICENVRTDRRTSSQAPKEKGKCGSAHFPFPAVRESVQHFPFSCGQGPGGRRAERQEQDVASQIRDAMAERHQGQIELAQALDAEEEADAALRPYQQAFAAAHRALEEAWANPEAGPV